MSKLENFRKDLDSILPGLIIDNVKFRGTTIGDYNFSNCFDGTLSIGTLKQIGIANLERLNKIKGVLDSNPFEKRKTKVSADEARLARVCEGLIACYEYLYEEAAVARLNAKLKRENESQIEVLKQIKAKKTLGSLERKSIKSIDSMIAKLKKETTV